MNENNLISIPRVKSRASNKNTIEWEIPDKVSVCLMLVEKIGYTVLVKVKVEKKHWWNSSYKRFTVSSLNPIEATIKMSNFLEQYGYYIDHNTVEFGEKIGSPDSLNNSGQDKTDKGIDVLDELIDEADEEIIRKTKKEIEKSFKKFLLFDLDRKKPFEEQFKAWLISLGDAITYLDTESYIDRALDKYKGGGGWKI
jgi:hypothetical protein